MVVTCHSQMANGTNVLSSRSDAEDIEACSPNPVKPRPRTSTADTRGFIRGACFASGYVLRPLPIVPATSSAEANFEAGCEVRFACHVNMRGGGSTNELRRGFLVDDVFATLMELAKLPPVPRVEFAAVVQVAQQNVAEPEAALELASAVADSSPHVADQAPHAAEETAPLSTGHLEQLRQCSLASLALLKHVHHSVTAGLAPAVLEGANGSEDNKYDDEREVAPVSSTGTRARARGVTITERPLLNNKVSVPMGTVMCATCTTAAAPAVVRHLLRDHPRSVDNMLEGHRVLLTLPHSSDGTSLTSSASTYVQHLQYGSIWVRLASLLSLHIVCFVLH